MHIWWYSCYCKIASKLHVARENILALGRRGRSARNVPIGEERRETDVFAAISSSLSIVISLLLTVDREVKILYRFIIYSTMWIATVNEYNFLVYVWLFCPFFLQLSARYQVLLTVIWPTVDLRHFTWEWGNIKSMLQLLQDSWRKTPG